MILLHAAVFFKGFFEFCSIFAFSHPAMPVPQTQQARISVKKDKGFRLVKPALSACQKLLIPATELLF